MARADLIQEDVTLGTRRERWWARPDSQVLVIPGTDVEGRAIDDRMLAMFFARDEEVRHGYLVDGPSPAWQKASFVGNWFVRLTAREADELGRALFALVDELRRRPERRSGRQTLVSLSVLPVRSAPKGGEARAQIPRLLGGQGQPRVLREGEEGSRDLAKAETAHTAQARARVRLTVSKGRRPRR